MTFSKTATLGTATSSKSINEAEFELKGGTAACGIINSFKLIIHNLGQLSGKIFIEYDKICDDSIHFEAS